MIGHLLLFQENIMAEKASGRSSTSSLLSLMQWDNNEHSFLP